MSKQIGPNNKERNIPEPPIPMIVCFWTRGRYISKIAIDSTNYLDQVNRVENREDFLGWMMSSIEDQIQSMIDKMKN